jgi:hypothetical protein
MKPHHGVQLLNHSFHSETTHMCLDRYARNFGFGLGALAALGVLFYSLEYEPLFSALAR